MAEDRAGPCIVVAVGDPALRARLGRWLLDEGLQPVDDLAHPQAEAVLADRPSWSARERAPTTAGALRWIPLDVDADWRARLAALRAGVRHFVPAPLTREALLRTLRNAGIEPAAPRPSVLVAGDVPDGERHVEMLARAGAQVGCAPSVDRMFELLASQTPDVLVLLDGIVGASAGDLMRLIRADMSFDGVMMLALLGNAEDARELPAGASFLLEPVSALALCDAVYDRWRRRRRMQAAEASLQRVLALQEQERAALDAHALVSVSDSAGSIVYVNDQFCRTSGWSREELIGRNHRIAKSGLQAPQVYAELWATISRGGVWQGELCNLRKDGSTYWVATTIMPLGAQEGPRPTQYLAIRTDITAQKEAQFALARQIERLEQMSRLAGVGSWDYELATGALRCSAQACRILGHAPDAAIGCADALRRFEGAETRRRVREACVATLRAGAPFEFEVPLLTPQRERRWVRLLAAAHGRGAGADRLVGAIQDVSEARRARQALQQAHDDADRANRAKSAFVSSMSHELRTPLNAILGFGQLLELDLPTGSQAHRQVQEILRGGRHLLALIDDLLDLARIESGRLDLVPEAVVVAEVVDDCLRLVQPLAAARGIAVTAEVAADLAVRADRLRLRQVLMNLLSNAIKYNFDGGRVEVRAGAEAGRVRVAVSDSGRGIAPQRLGELFQPFNRLGAERGPVEGTGIGLVIARDLVERMHGAIGVESLPGAGSLFWIELPGGARADVFVEFERGPQPAGGG